MEPKTRRGVFWPWNSPRPSHWQLGLNLLVRCGNIVSRFTEQHWSVLTGYWQSPPFVKKLWWSLYFLRLRNIGRFTGSEQIHLGLEFAKKSLTGGNLKVLLLSHFRNSSKGKDQSKRWINRRFVRPRCGRFHTGRKTQKYGVSFSRKITLLLVSFDVCKKNSVLRVARVWEEIGFRFANKGVNCGKCEVLQWVLWRKHFWEYIIPKVISHRDR